MSIQNNIIDGRSYNHEVLEHYRFRAIELYKEGEKVKDIARFFGVHRGSVSRWITTYKRKGKRELKSKKAPGPPYKLTDKEMKEVFKIFWDDATVHGFETPLWTCKRVQQVIQKRTKKKLHTTNVMRWLKRWGLTNQKPKRRAYERDETAVQRWLKEDWPKIKAHVRRWQAMLYFQDESGVSLTAVLGKTWALRGQTPTVKVTGKRGGFCVTSAISPAGKMVVVEDRAPPHTAKKVKDFVEENRKKLAVYYLPSYAPELNPDEHVWEYLKAYKLKSHQAKNTDDLKKLVKRKMQSIQRKKGLVNSFFVGTYVT